jgi:DNA mismatch repair protein MutH
MKLPYNPKDKKSVIDYAKLLKGKTLRQICDPTNFRTQLHR